MGLFLDRSLFWIWRTYKIMIKLLIHPPHLALSRRCTRRTYYNFRLKAKRRKCMTLMYVCFFLFCASKSFPLDTLVFQLGHPIFKILTFFWKYFRLRWFTWNLLIFVVVVIGNWGKTGKFNAIIVSLFSVFSIYCTNNLVKNHRKDFHRTLI